MTNDMQLNRASSNEEAMLAEAWARAPMLAEAWARAHHAPAYPYATAMQAACPQNGPSPSLQGACGVQGSSILGHVIPSCHPEPPPPASVACERSVYLSLSGASAIQIGPGEAFARATVLDLLKRCAHAAVMRDREHRPSDGWMTGKAARLLVMDILREVLRDEAAPRDAAACIVTQVAARMDDALNRTEF